MCGCHSRPHLPQLTATRIVRTDELEPNGRRASLYPQLIDESMENALALVGYGIERRHELIDFLRNGGEEISSHSSLVVEGSTLLRASAREYLGSGASG